MLITLINHLASFYHHKSTDSAVLFIRNTWTLNDLRHLQSHDVLPQWCIYIWLFLAVCATYYISHCMGRVWLLHGEQLADKWRTVIQRRDTTVWRRHVGAFQHLMLSGFFSRASACSVEHTSYFTLTQWRPVLFDIRMWWLPCDILENSWMRSPSYLAMQQSNWTRSLLQWTMVGKADFACTYFC